MDNQDNKVYSESLEDLIKLKHQVEQHIETKKRNDLLKSIEMKIEKMEKLEIVTK